MTKRLLLARIRKELATEGMQFYTICFKKDFMDKVRKDPDLAEARPIMRGA